MAQAPLHRLAARGSRAGSRSERIGRTILPGVRVASGKFWSDSAEQRLCAFGGRVLIAAAVWRRGGKDMMTTPEDQDAADWAVEATRWRPTQWC